MKRKKLTSKDELFGKDETSKLLDQSALMIKQKKHVLKTIEYDDIADETRQRIYNLLKKAREKPRTKQKLEKMLSFHCEFYAHKGDRYASYSHQFLTELYYWKQGKDGLYYPY
ncbi:MAG: hypothetical protein AABX55_00540 [Nanoarchaeota archaeon]